MFNRAIECGLLGRARLANQPPAQARQPESQSHQTNNPPTNLLSLIMSWQSKQHPHPQSLPSPPDCSPKLAYSLACQSPAPPPPRTNHHSQADRTSPPTLSALQTSTPTWSEPAPSRALPSSDSRAESGLPLQATTYVPTHRPPLRSFSTPPVPGRLTEPLPAV